MPLAFAGRVSSVRTQRVSHPDRTGLIDVESMRLKRLIDKRSQMFDMLRQVIDKYNQTAKGMIDSVGR